MDLNASSFNATGQEMLEGHLSILVDLDSNLKTRENTQLRPVRVINKSGFYILRREKKKKNSKK